MGSSAQVAVTCMPKNVLKLFVEVDSVLNLRAGNF